MRKLIIFIFMILSIDSYSQIKNGYYYGEKFINKKGNSKCYYENTLLIRNDSIYLGKYSKCIVDKDTCDAAADYACFEYAGFISKNKNKIYITTFLTGCDYCVFAISSDSSNISLGFITYRLYRRGDYLIFNHVRYKYFPDKFKSVNVFNFKDKFNRYNQDQEGAMDEPNIVIDN